MKRNPVIKIKNITGNGDVDIGGCQFIDDDTAQKAIKFKLNDGDLLMAMTGATVAKTGILFTEDRNVYLNQRVAKFESEKFGSPDTTRSFGTALNSHYAHREPI